MSLSPKPQRGSIPSPYIHLIFAYFAIVLLAGAVLVFDQLASNTEGRYVHALAPLLLPQTDMGSVVQQAAFQQPDLLPVYGSSEQLKDVPTYGAYNFFSAYPTGFEVIDFAQTADTSLNMAQALAAIGPELKGRRVVIAFTPTMFTAKEVSTDYYAGDFSRMHAYALAFSPDLSLAVKRLAARRMLEYPDTLSNDPLLSFALQNLAGDAIYNRLLYYMIFPLGQLEYTVIRMQDHYAILNYLQQHPKIKPDVQHKPAVIDWNKLFVLARTQQIADTNSNPYGIQNDVWIRNYHGFLKTWDPGSGDAHFIAALNQSKEWGDLAILLETLKELGAQPLIMSWPINGTLDTVTGISSKAQQAYYAKLQNLLETYSMPLVDFQQYTNDPFFTIDQMSHTSREGWVVVDQTLDAYYHGQDLGANNSLGEVGNHVNH